jgi:hypothetical protein
MDPNVDLLYSIFEQYLFNALVEDETTEDFLTRVVREYVARLSHKGKGTIPREFAQSIETDLREEVLEMFRMKTYGHYNLADFRKAHAAVPQKTKAPRNRRAS